MLSLPDLQQKIDARKLPVPELLHALRSYQYSLSPEERAEVVRLLARIDHVDAVRELITLYQECEWRNTRLAIVRRLGIRPHQRSLEFLMKLAMEHADLPMAEAAIRALGSSRHPLAARFLANLYRSGSPVFRPAVVGALAQIPDASLLPEFLAELPKSLRQNDKLLGSQLILALAELKATEALPLIRGLLAEGTDPGLRHCAILAVGKLARDPRILDPLESDGDPLEQQLLLNARNQVQIRSHWTIENYLQKIFEDGHFHPMLPLELNTFPPEDIAAGMELFWAPEKMLAWMATLRHVRHPQRLRWYLDGLGDPEALLQSLACHSDEHIAPVLLQVESLCMADPTLFDRWLEAISLCLPRADAEFQRHLTSDGYARLPAAAKVTLLNHLANFGMIHLPDGKATKRVAVVLEQALFAETDAHVQGRLLRALAQVGICGARVLAWIQAHLQRAELLPSALQLLERVAPKGGMALLLACIQNPAIAQRHAAGILRALRRQSGEMPANASEIDAFLAWALGPTAASEVQLAALHCLGSHPRRVHHPAVVGWLSGEERFVLAALAALKQMGMQETADAVAPLLLSPSESVVGRAVDALTGLPGIKAARLLLEVLKSNLSRHDLCDKILRAMQPPNGNRSELVAILDQLLLDHAGHPLVDGFYALRERMIGPAAVGDQTLGAEVPRIDADLARRIRGYVRFDDPVKVVLRASELPFFRPALYKGQLDKSISVLGYCKALDLYLESTLGQRLLFPRLRTHLYDFQRLVHAGGLADDPPSLARVSDYFALADAFPQTGVPLHKMSLVAQGILSGKILLGNQWKILDGLRAWAVVLMMFGTDLRGGRALLPLRMDRGELCNIAERLCLLQDLRNPIAHRQTLLSFPAIDRARTEAEQLFNLLGGMWGEG